MVEAKQEILCKNNSRWCKKGYLLLRNDLPVPKYSSSGNKAFLTEVSLFAEKFVQLSLSYLTQYVKTTKDSRYRFSSQFPQNGRNDCLVLFQIFSFHRETCVREFLARVKSIWSALNRRLKNAEWNFFILLLSNHLASVDKTYIM